MSEILSQLGGCKRIYMEWPDLLVFCMTLPLQAEPMTWVAAQCPRMTFILKTEVQFHGQGGRRKHDNCLSNLTSTHK